MRAIVQDRYGPLDQVLSVAEVDVPVPGENEVLVRVRAASIHIGDCHGMRGAPYVMRPIFGLKKPKARVPGTDLAGVVESVGPGVVGFAPGDEVFGWGDGAFAQFAAVPEGQLLSKPGDLSFEQAAALGVSATTALVAIRDEGEVESGQKVLINGASGGVGSFAVQIAKHHGADVTGVCSGRSADIVRSAGADHVIDYTQTDFTQGGAQYDLVLDNVGNHSLRDTRRAVADGGTLLSNGAPVHGWFGGLDHVIAAMLQSLVVKKQGRPFVALSSIERLSTVKELAESGAISPVIDSVYPLDQGPEAIQHVVDGHAHGTVVISMDEAPTGSG